MKILFLVPYPTGASPSQRFRFEQYFGALEKAGYQLTVHSFLSKWGWQIIYQRGRHLQKAFAIVSGFVRRLFILPKAASVEYVFIHREAAPVGPPIIEWIIAKVLGKKIIYDFDDAIWLTDVVNENFIQKISRWRSKVGSICKWAYKVSAGNDYLCTYASQFNKNVVLNPTTIDTDYHLPQQKEDSDVVTIGWTGSHSTLKYLDNLVPVLKDLETKHPLKIIVIANDNPAYDLKSLQFVPWNKTTEMRDLQRMDIGIMPLPDDVWSKGKCGFKALQYMALEVPAVVSPVGVNTKIINDGVDGFIASRDDEWRSILEKLVIDRTLRKEIGKAARRKVIDRYSISSNSSNFLSLFDPPAMIVSATR